MASSSEPVPNIKQSTDTIHRDVATNYATYANPGVMSEVQGLDAITAATTSAEYGSPHYSHYGTWVSNPLNWQWVNGTVTVALSMREGNSGANVYPRLKIYRWCKNDTKGEELRAIGDSATEVTTAYPTTTPTTYFNAVALTPTRFDNGDRIVVEIESYDNNAVTTSWLHGLRYGGTGSYNSYIQFSTNLTYAHPRSIAAYTGSTAIRDWINSHSPEEINVFLATATATAFQGRTFPYDITYGDTVLTIEKFRYDPYLNTCGFWLHATRNGQEVATNSPVWVFPPPYQVIDSEAYDATKNEWTIKLREDPKLAFEQTFGQYVNRTDIGTAVVGTKE